MDFTDILRISILLIIIAIIIAIGILYNKAQYSKVKEIAERKGYDGDAWAKKFLFNVFTTPHRVLLELEALPDRNKNKENASDPYIPEDKNSWQCGCGIVNPGYTGTCSCGRTKENPDEVQETDDNFDKIREYKKLLDDGIITEEEFEQKKVDLLNL